MAVCSLICVIWHDQPHWLQSKGLFLFFLKSLSHTNSVMGYCSADVVQYLQHKAPFQFLDFSFFKETSKSYEHIQILDSNFPPFLHKCLLLTTTMVAALQCFFSTHNAYFRHLWAVTFRQQTFQNSNIKCLKYSSVPNLIPSQTART